MKITDLKKVIIIGNIGLGSTCANTKFYNQKIKNMKILNNNMYLLLVDEEAEIKEGDFIYIKGHALNNPIKVHKIINLQVKLDSSRFMVLDQPKEDCKKIIAYYPLNSEAKELDLPLLPNPFEEVDIFKLMDKETQKYYINNPEYYSHYIVGYKAAQPKQYSLEDILKFRKVLEEGTLTNMSCASAIVEFDKFIQSLSTQELPKEFILGEGDTIEEQIKNGYYE